MYPRLHKTLKLSPHEHTGKQLSHRATSHGVLAALLIATGLLLVMGTKALLVSANDMSASGSIGLSGAVPGPSPQSAAIITQPADGQRFTSSPVTVTGTCVGNNFIQIFKNGVFAGSTACKGGDFSLEIELIIGKNELMARIYDNLGQFGPDSATVTVYYQPASTSGRNVTGASTGTTTGSSASQQLLVTTESAYQGIKAGIIYNFKITILGGQTPYAVVIQWGDGQQSVLARGTAGQFNADHTYNDGGIYTASIEITDGAGNKATLQTIMLVTGTPKPLAIGTNDKNIPPVTEVPDLLDIIWPIYLLCVVAVCIFWFGERYELYKLRRVDKLKVA